MDMVGIKTRLLSSLLSKVPRPIFLENHLLGKGFNTNIELFTYGHKKRPQN